MPGAAEQSRKEMTMELTPCSCGSRVFSKITEVRGWVTDLLTVTASGEIKVKRVANKVRIEREPKRVCCEGCGKRQPLFVAK